MPRQARTYLAVIRSLTSLTFHPPRPSYMPEYRWHLRLSNICRFPQPTCGALTAACLRSITPNATMVAERTLTVRKSKTRLCGLVCSTYATTLLSLAGIHNASLSRLFTVCRSNVMYAAEQSGSPAKAPLCVPRYSFRPITPYNDRPSLYL